MNAEDRPVRPIKDFIKRDIIFFLFICFVIGTFLIWYGGHLSLIHLSDDGRVNDTVLWLTALGIFWYAYETYQLKISTTDQANISEVIMQNEFLPILEPVAAKAGTPATIRSGNFVNLEFRNLGKGPAKYIELHIGKSKFDMEWSLAGGESKSIRLPAAARREVREIIAENPSTIRLRIIYQDIYKRKFQTQHIVFERSRGTYHLKQGAWDFKRIRTQ